MKTPSFIIIRSNDRYFDSINSANLYLELGYGVYILPISMQCRHCHIAPLLPYTYVDRLRYSLFTFVVFRNVLFTKYVLFHFIEML